MIDIGEAVMATVGIQAVIRGEMPIVGVEKLKEIETLQAQIDELAQKLVDDTLPEPTFRAEGNYRTLLDRLSKPLTPDEVQVLAAKFRGDATELIAPFTIGVQQAYEHIRAIFPIAEYATFAGPTNLVPDTDKVWRFFLELQVIEAPLGVFALIGAGALLQIHVDVLKQFYSSIANAIDAAITLAVATKRGGETSYHLPPFAEIGMSVWKGQREVDRFPAPKVTPGVKRPPSAAPAKALETTGQKAAE